MNEYKRSEEPELYNGMPVPSDTPVPVSEEITVDNTEGLEERIVYDGDISDSILAKLSAYYNENADQEEYVIYRADQYNYYLVYGDYNNGQFTNATTVLYHVQSSYNTVDCTVTVSSGVSIRPDLTGDTGYIYSSIPSFIPSRYIDKHMLSTKSAIMIMTVLLTLSVLITIIGMWVHKMRKRWL